MNKVQNPTIKKKRKHFVYESLGTTLRGTTMETRVKGPPLRLIWLT